MKKNALIATLVFSLFSVPAAFAEMVNINKADVAALDSLNGIGAKKAEAIVAYRTAHGDFKTLEALKDVPGIGDKLFEKIATDISLTDDATAVAEKSAKAGTEKEATVKADATADKAEVKTDTQNKQADAADEKTEAKVEAKTDSQDKKAESADKADKVSDKVSSTTDKS
jgi:competence protein ComEA